QFVIAEAVEIGATHRLRLVPLEFAQAPVDAGPLAATDRRLLGVRRQIGDLDRYIDVVGNRPPGPECIEGVVTRHRHQPAYRTIAAGRVTVGALPDLDVDFLQRLFGFGPVLQDTQRDAE